MEENKVKAKEAEVKSPKVREYSKEELQNIAHQLSEQGRQLFQTNQQLTKALEEANLENYFKRLEWLWKVINSDCMYITTEFKRNCGKEFMDMMSTEEKSNKEE